MTPNLRHESRIKSLTPAGHNANGKLMVLLECQCGNKKVVRKDHAGVRTLSCGCLHSDVVRTITRTHGHNPSSRCKSPTYSSWQNMKKRCMNPLSIQWKDYGGRGIGMCERWMKFENFLADMGVRPPLHSLDRISNDGNYEPGNCRWSTAQEQCNNSRRNRYLTFNGAKRSVADWSRIVGLSPYTLLRRINRGWDTEKALTAPLHHGVAQ